MLRPSEVAVPVARNPSTTAYTAAVRRTAPLLALLALALLAAGCADDEPATAPPQPEPTAQTANFPRADGRTAGELEAGAEEGPILSPSVSVLDPGRNRFAFALYDTARKHITGAQVALYTARRDGKGAHGPYPARLESLAVKPQFASRTSSRDPDAAKTVYVADLPFRDRGQRAVWALVRLDGRMLRTNSHSIDIGSRDAVPRVGEQAIRVNTLTAADVGNDLRRITTRVPPARELLQDDFADVLGRRPVVITFATPQLCQSRVCGPVVDIVEQVRSTAPKDVAFIQQEIYKDNEVSKGVRPQVARWHLPTEPWTFVIDRGGRISARLEGAFSVGELQRAVAKVAG
jgi:hypothetical protein